MIEYSNTSISFSIIGYKYSYCKKPIMDFSMIQSVVGSIIKWWNCGAVHVLVDISRHLDHRFK